MTLYPGCTDRWLYIHCGLLLLVFLCSRTMRPLGTLIAVTPDFAVAEYQLDKTI